MSRAWLENGGGVYPGAEANLAQLAEAAASYGFFNTTPDPDGTLRRALLLVCYPDEVFFFSLCVEKVPELNKITDQECSGFIMEKRIVRPQFGEPKLRARRVALLCSKA